MGRNGVRARLPIWWSVRVTRGSFDLLLNHERESYEGKELEQA
jgi:hypothetical protein